MHRWRGAPNPTVSDVEAARHLADRLERWPCRSITARGLVLIGIVSLVLLLSVSQWYQYRQVAHGGVPVTECSSTQRVVEYDVRWQWFPPGLVCDYEDGTSEYVGM